jgi:hypothetical protein
MYSTYQLLCDSHEDCNQLHPSGLSEEIVILGNDLVVEE